MLRRAGHRLYDTWTCDNKSFVHSVICTCIYITLVKLILFVRRGYKFVQHNALLKKSVGDKQLGCTDDRPILTDLLWWLPTKISERLVNLFLLSFCNDAWIQRWCVRPCILEEEKKAVCINLEGVWGALILAVVLTHPNVCVLFFLSDPAFQNFLPDRSSWGFPRQPNIAQTLPLTDRLGLPPTLHSGAKKFSRGSHRRVWKEIWFSATTVNSSGFEWRPFSQETYKFKSGVILKAHCA